MFYGPTLTFFRPLRRHISTHTEGNEALADLLLNASGNLQELLVSKQLIQAFRIVKLIGKSVLDDSNDTFNEGDIIEVVIGVGGGEGGCCNV